MPTKITTQIAVAGIGMIVGSGWPRIASIASVAGLWPTGMVIIQGMNWTSQGARPISIYAPYRMASGIPRTGPRPAKSVPNISVSEK